MVFFFGCARYRALPAEAVEPFAAWRALMAEPDSSAASPLLPAGPMRARISSPRLPAPAAPAAPAASELSFELHALVAVAAAPEQPCEGLLLHYYARSNTAVISHLVLSKGRNVGPVLDKVWLRERDILLVFTKERAGTRRAGSVRAGEGFSERLQLRLSGD